ncbi:T9SS type A sorting domain-containing protein [Flavobacterium psychrotolerans]|uniref:Secretion system C-terminal sorting domain-containing protein n=1 Tax=Flavobacterium psychrotolerans TaxID=2169410 RepID=A0A2U1JFL2_9FLAO|nr:T9SS type A sorting domain-containing protein [Flavobacterium psychrotolerans]PWA03906.1 hypothetical protein DB895_13695 [Flavobacterium psychrotolerans]
MYKTISCLFTLFITFNSNAQTKILFDATKAQMAGNADWVIDADAHNIFFNSTTHLPYTSNGIGASNPQRMPTPAQSGITASTPETYWQGSLSYWAIDCVKKGYTVESLPFNVAITYGNVNNPQDLSNYKVFVVDEPNSLFTAAEKTAIINFVKNGGGLCMISDHDVSDRNFDGYDSPHIWNDLMSDNTVQNNPFGITFDYANFSQTSSNVASILTNPILHGTAGNVTQVKWTSGTTMTLNTTNNSTALGLVFKTGSSKTGLLNTMIASATYQKGKVVAIGDSSIPDDGTGDSNDVLYDGYITDAAGNHQRLLMNSIIWLATSSTLSVENNSLSHFNFSVVPNPIQNKELKINYTLSENEPITVSIFDTLGRTTKTYSYSNNEMGFNTKSISLDNLNAGIYFCKITTASSSNSLPFIIN